MEALEGLSSFPFQYIIDQRNATHSTLELFLPVRQLLEWQRIVNEVPSLSYLKLLQLNLQANNVPVELKPGSERIEERLRVLASLSHNNCRTTTGAVRQRLMNKTKKIQVFSQELVNVSGMKKRLEARLEETEKKNNDLRKEVQDLNVRCEEFLLEVSELTTKLKKEQDKVQVLENELDDLGEENEALKCYIDNLEENLVCSNCSTDLKNCNKQIDEVEERQKSRKLKLLRTRAERALWFVKSFGLDIDSLSLLDNDGEHVQLSFGENNSQKSNFNNLSEAQKDKIRCILFIMDRFCVSDAAFHEFTMTVNGLEKSYLIKQCRNDLNSIIHITRTPGKEPGAHMNFKEELQFHLHEKMKKGDIISEKIKISGDGAKMSRISNFIVLSFSLLSDDEYIMSAYGNHAFAVISGKEDYNVLKRTCSELFKDINELISAKSINVDGKNISLEFFLSGDYKFLLLLLGMNAANSNYSCIYCKIHKSERWDMSKSEDYYWNIEQVKTLGEMTGLADKSKNNYGSLHKPLLDVPLQNIRVDELHLFLRITDILERNLIYGSIEWDRNTSGSNEHLRDVVNAICQCGVAFSVWEKRNGDGKTSGSHEWTSMIGGDKKKVLNLLPDKLHSVVQPEISQTVVQIWKDFKILYDAVTEWNPNPNTKNSFFEMATKWVKLFLTLGGVAEGYGKQNITPYIHILCYHVPHFLKQDLAMKRFTGQGIEKINDIVRSFYHQKSNKHDACKESLQALKRVDRLRNFERTPQKYDKRKTEYWEGDIFEQRRKRLRLSVQSRDDNIVAEGNSNVDELGLQEIKEKLKELGIKSRVKNLEKLREILRKAVQNN